MLKILMLGNSFTFVNDMPQMLAELTGAEVIVHARGGARLAEQLNPKTKMGAKTLEALQMEHWNYVILQEMSNGPIVSRQRFLEVVSALCEKIRAVGAVPVLYETWPYKEGSPAMEKMEISYDEMYRLLSDAYHEAARQNDALIADAGEAFYKRGETEDLYAADGCHPNEAGSRLAAEVLAEAVKGRSGQS